MARKAAVIAGRRGFRRLTTESQSVPAAPLKAALWMLGALLSFSGMAVAGREISAELDTFQLMFYRSVLGFLIILGIAAATGGFGQFQTRRLGLHVSRNAIHFVGQFGWFYGVALIPLAEVFAIEFTSPLWVALLAPFFLGERLTRARVLAVVVGFCGAMVVIRPGFTEFNAGTLAVLVAALGFAGSTITTKRLAATEAPLAILFYMSLVQAPLGLLPSLGNLQMPGGVTWAWLVVVTLAGLSAHFCMAQAFRRADATLVIPIDYLRLPLIALVGMALYAEPLDPFILIGGAIILAGNYWNIRAETRPVAGPGA